MRYMDIIMKPWMPDKRTINIPIKQLGLSKVVIVKTRGNGGVQ